MKIKQSSSNVTFLDLILNSLLVFVCLFVLSYIMVSFKKEDQSSKTKGEFLITFEWDKESETDIDGYTEDPLGNLVFFRIREAGLLHLAQDDLGSRSDTVRTEFGEVKIKQNFEVITVRGIVPGEYCVNVHSYTFMDKQPLKVKVMLEKVNPYKIVTVKELEFSRHGQEQTAFRFTVDKDGNVTEVNNLNKSLIEGHLRTNDIGLEND